MLDFDSWIKAAFSLTLEFGYHITNAPGPPDELLRAFRRAAKKVSATTLVVREGQDHRPNTLSARHGSGAFPLHTDFAYLGLPPRFLVMVNFSEESFERETLVASFADFPHDLLQALDRSVWSAHSGLGHVLLSGSVNTFEGRLRRWDLDFLRPYNVDAGECLERATELRHINAQRVSWGPYTALFVDNWASVHGRAHTDQADVGRRRLRRFEIWP